MGERYNLPDGVGRPNPFLRTLLVWGLPLLAWILLIIGWLLIDRVPDWLRLNKTIALIPKVAGVAVVIYALLEWV